MAPQKKLFLLAGVVAVLLVGGLFLVLRRDGGTTDPAPSGTVVVPSSLPPATPLEQPKTITDDLTIVRTDVDHRVVKPQTGAAPAPTLQYTYALLTKLPQVKQTAVAVDTFARIDEVWARGLAARYGIADQQPFIDGDTYVFMGDLTKPGSAVLRVNARSGYSDYTTVLLEDSNGTLRGSADAIRIARAFLTKTKQLPASLDTPVTYARASFTGVTFVEFHRPWTPLPILETTGMLTADLTNRTANRPADKDIVQTSDKTDGLARPTDFNTITVAIDEKGRVLSATVNMRPVARTLPSRAIKTPQQAWDELAAGKGILGFTLPSESNLSGKKWEDIFPGGVAKSDAAQVREITLAFVEKPDGVRQTYLQPVYIFKGSAKLATGPLADFIVAVPALADDSLPAS